MDKSFDYKCSNCGGTVQFDQLTKKWVCTYCNSVFDNLFINDDSKELEGASKGYLVHYYYCDNCSNSFYSADNLEDCFICHNHLNKTYCMIDNVISNTVNLDYASMSIHKALLPFSKKYNIDLNNIKSKIKYEYIKCFVFNGTINISNGRKSYNFLFLNLIYPFLNNNNYKVLYDFSNQGFNTVNNSITPFKMIGAKEFKISREENNRQLDDKEIRDKIIKECINKFSSMYGKKNIKVNDKLTCDKNVLLNVCYYPYICNDKEYRTYYINMYNRGYYNQLTTFGTKRKYGLVSVDLPKQENKSALSIVFPKYTRILLLILSVIGLIVSPFMLYFQFLISTEIIANKILGIIFVGSIIFLIISKILHKIAFKNEVLYEAKEDMYYKNIIRNSNFVKMIKG